MTLYNVFFSNFYRPDPLLTFSDARVLLQLSRSSSFTEFVADVFVLLQLDVDELEETQDFYDDEDEPQDEEDENVQKARMSLASIFGETEVLEVDEAQQDESLLVRFCGPLYSVCGGYIPRACYYIFCYNRFEGSRGLCCILGVVEVPFLCTSIGIPQHLGNASAPIDPCILDLRRKGASGCCH